MFIEFTDNDGKVILINSNRVLLVRAEDVEKCAYLLLNDGDVRINVRQPFEEIKKRLGMAIVPRAETLAVN